MLKENILIVDDNRANLYLLSKVLTEHGYAVRAVRSGAEALEAVQSFPPDLILLDIMMPEMNGYQVCQTLKASAGTHTIPIIFISALDETEDKVNAFSLGGVDYITKPLRFEEVLARVKTHLALQSLQNRLRQEIEERDKLIAELDAYAHTVAHDLKNPLGLITGYAEVLATDYAVLLPEALQQSAQSIARGARKMTTIIENLLLLASARKMEVVPTPLDMGVIVSETLYRLDSMLEEHKTELVIPETWPIVLGYAPWVEEVWVNYVSNAIKYGGQPPCVTLGADAQPNGLASPSVRFWVRDNGPGIPPDKQARLFAPFERLDQVRIKGHGLGLSIVRRIVEKLAGQVGVESQVGVGSTFWFMLPAHRPEQEGGGQ